MQRRKLDRRVVRTRKAIKDAFIALLYEKDLSDITITDIVDCSDVNRSTFYAHFHDKENLIDCLVDELIADLIASYQTTYQPFTKQNRGFPTRAIEAMFEFVSEHADTFKILLNTMKVPQFTPILYASLYKYAVEQINELRGAEYDLNVHYGFYANYLASTFISFIHYWLMNKDRKYKPEYIAEEYMKVLLSNPLSSYMRGRAVSK
ncbi:TetR/AcrR family transcriptional regulator [Sporosarcina sp. FSL W7-1349]|uniref:TetR/AcrR family transcriptional regulator n=1 Tax=Sporosarcina sp. FSL W7-1349 TaxID=2921561 RepID=UPI0030F66E56